MKNLLWIIAGCLLVTAVSARDVNQSLDADPAGNVEIYNTAGSVSVEGWSRGAVEVTGTVDDDIEEFIFERDGDDVTVKVEPRHGNRHGGRGQLADLLIRLPQGSSIEVTTVSADIEVTGVEGEQELQSVSGDVIIESMTAEVEVETVSGDIEVRGNGEDSEIELVSVSGDITVRDLAGTVALETVNGELDLVGGSFAEAEFETVNGRIIYTAGLRKGGELEIATVNGRVDVTFVGPVSADIDIETFNGRIKNCFGPKPVKVSKYTPGWELSFTEGDGDGQVYIETLNGGVNLCTE